jgi:hypothetical protein
MMMVVLYYSGSRKTTSTINMSEIVFEIVEYSTQLPHSGRI